MRGQTPSGFRSRLSVSNRRCRISWRPSGARPPLARPRAMQSGRPLPGSVINGPDRLPCVRRSARRKRATHSVRPGARTRRTSDCRRGRAARPPCRLADAAERSCGPSVPLDQSLRRATRLCDLPHLVRPYGPPDHRQTDLGACNTLRVRRGGAECRSERRGSCRRMRALRSAVLSLASCSASRAFVVHACVDAPPVNGSSATYSSSKSVRSARRKLRS